MESYKTYRIINRSSETLREHNNVYHPIFKYIYLLILEYKIIKDKVLFFYFILTNNTYKINDKFINLKLKKR